MASALLFDFSGIDLSQTAEGRLFTGDKAIGLKMADKLGGVDDAVALMLLSMAAANSTKGADWTAKVMDIANAPGEQILPGDLAKALDLIAEGKDIDYVGATSVELIGAGESAGNFREYEIKDGKIETVGFR